MPAADVRVVRRHSSMKPPMHARGEPKEKREVHRHTQRERRLTHFLSRSHSATTLIRSSRGSSFPLQLVASTLLTGMRRSPSSPSPSSTLTHRASLSPPPLPTTDHDEGSLRRNRKREAEGWGCWRALREALAGTEGRGTHSAHCYPVSVQRRHRCVSE